MDFFREQKFIKVVPATKVLKRMRLFPDVFNKHLKIRRVEAVALVTDLNGSDHLDVKKGETQWLDILTFLDFLHQVFFFC